MSEGMSEFWHARSYADGRTCSGSRKENHLFMACKSSLTGSLAYNVHELADSPIDYVEAANHSLDR